MTHTHTLYIYVYYIYAKYVCMYTYFLLLLQPSELSVVSRHVFLKFQISFGTIITT